MFELEREGTYELPQVMEATQRRPSDHGDVIQWLLDGDVYLRLVCRINSRAFSSASSYLTSVSCVPVPFLRRLYPEHFGRC